jgi:hypothetical protein
LCAESEFNFSPLRICFICILQARELGVTPMQLAEYVFWTGDERGVSLAIQEFLQQGLVS